MRRRAKRALPFRNRSLTNSLTEWESSGLPPDFDTFLPDADAIRRSALIDMIRVDLEHRWLRAPTETALGILR